MANISAEQVKQLRDKTGAGMMDCKKALTEVGGDMDKAIDYLRAKGLAKAAKKAGREATEGAVVSYNEAGNLVTDIFLLRRPLTADDLTPEKLAADPEYGAARDGEGRLHLSVKDPRFWPAAGTTRSRFPGRVATQGPAVGRPASRPVSSGVSAGVHCDA